MDFRRLLNSRKIAEIDVEELQAELKKIAGVFGKKDTAQRIVDLAKNTFGVKKDISGSTLSFRIARESF